MKGSVKTLGQEKWERDIVIVAQGLHSARPILLTYKIQVGYTKRNNVSKQMTGWDDKALIFALGAGDEGEAASPAEDRANLSMEQ